MRRRLGAEAQAEIAPAADLLDDAPEREELMRREVCARRQLRAREPCVLQHPRDVNANGREALEYLARYGNEIGVHVSSASPPASSRPASRQSLPGRRSPSTC